MLRTAAAVGVMWVCLMGGVWAAEGVEREQEVVSPEEEVFTPGEGVPSPEVREERVFSPGDALHEALMELGRQSTVFAFNFSNLFILLALKVIVLFVLGGLGWGIGKRSVDLDDRSWLDGGDVLFTLTYLVSDGMERYDCLNRLACLDQHKAQELLTAATMMLRGAKLFKPIFGYSLEKYEKLSTGMEDAILYKREGGSCYARYSCSAMPSL